MFDEPIAVYSASTRSGLRSPECPSCKRTGVAPPPGLQRGPGCEARSVSLCTAKTGGCAFSFNEVRAAKPGVSRRRLSGYQRLDIRFNEVRAAKPGVSPKGAPRWPQWSASFNEVRAAKPGVSLSRPYRPFLRRRRFNEVRAAKPGVSRQLGVAWHGYRTASTRSGLRSPECPLHDGGEVFRDLRLQRGPGCEARSVDATDAAKSSLDELQRGPGCEARSVPALGLPRPHKQFRFNEVRAAKPGVSHSAAPSSPAQFSGFNEVRAAKPGVSVDAAFWFV